jgi:CO/xanthine dehydrogenase Mo-binding subunit
LGSEASGRRLRDAFLAKGAAQCGICTPGMLISAKALLDTRPMPSKTDVEDALGGVLCRCTGYQKIVDAVLAAAGDDVGPVAADLSAGDAVGRRIARVDGPAKVDGAELFGADGIPSDALLVTVIRSPYHHARFELGDLDRFMIDHPGVVTVLTASDIPGENCHGVIPPFADQPVFAEGVARFKGEAIAAMVGEPSAMATFDADAFPVTWEERPALLDLDEASDENAGRLHAHRPGNLLTSGRVVCGDVEAGFEAADVILERDIETAWVEHAYIEPEAGFARRVGDRLEVHACTQAPHLNRESLARIMGVEPERIRIRPTAAGGGFGAKIDLTMQAYVALAAWHTGRPAGLVYTRPESMAASTKRHPGRMKMRAGVKHAGELTAVTFDGSFNTGAYASWGPTVASRVPVHASGPFVIRNYRAEARAIHSHGPIGGAFRGFGVPQAALAQETLFDQLADAIGMDRLAFRLKNALDVGLPTVTGQVFSDGVGIKACLKALEPHWHRARQDAAETNRRGRHMANRGPRRTGVGLACCWYGCGNTSLPNPSTIKLGLHRDGDVVLFQGAVDIGQGASTVISQIAADALGLPIGAFRLENADTDQTPDAGKTSASRQTFVSGNAAKLAGLSLRRELLRHANASDNATLDLQHGVLTIREAGVARVMELSMLEADEHGFVALVEESYDPPTSPLDDNGQGEPYALFGYGAQLVELSVDVELGIVQLDRLIAAHDVGRAINPTLIEGQVEGGVAQGVGLALMENYVPGRTENLHDYLIPTIGDMPEIETIIVEEPSSEGPFGAKGLGEHVLIPTAPAILNAIRDATGAVIEKLPATPDRVLAAIKGGGAAGSTRERP